MRALCLTNLGLGAATRSCVVERAAVRREGLSALRVLSETIAEPLPRYQLSFNDSGMV
jgi:hypothetical protein